MAEKHQDLWWAIERGDADTWEGLFAQEVDVKAVDKHGNTALHFAAAAGWDRSRSLEKRTELVRRRIKLVNQLLYAGSDVNKKGWAGWTPLHDAACNWNAEIVKILLQHNAKLDAVTDAGETPMYVAVVYAGPEVVKVLLDAGPDVDFRKANAPNGETALQHACHRGIVQVVKMLLEAGASVDAKGPLGRTALHRAVENGRSIPVVDALIDANADITIADDFGQTPLHFAVQRRQSPEMVTRLINTETLTSLDRSGETAFDIATRKKDDEVKNLLLRREAVDRKRG